MVEIIEQTVLTPDMDQEKFISSMDPMSAAALLPGIYEVERMDNIVIVKLRHRIGPMGIEDEGVIQVKPWVDRALVKVDTDHIRYRVEFVVDGVGPRTNVKIVVRTIAKKDLVSQLIPVKEKILMSRAIGLVAGLARQAGASMVLPMWRKELQY
jgi:carbon monoxide dehydrogenase subunit G